MQRVPISLPWIILITTQMKNHIHYEVWNEITHPLPNFNRATVEVWEWMSKFIPHFIGFVIIYPCADEC